MSDWDQLREVGQDVSPPSFESLVTTARRRDRRARIVTGAVAFGVVIALGLGLALADGEEDGPIQPAEDPSGSETMLTDEDSLPEGVLLLPSSDPGSSFATLGPGRYRVPLSSTLAFDVDVPRRTFSHANGLYLATDEIVLKVEVAGESYGVAADPCTDPTIEPVGPGVDDLVRAMRSQPSYQVSPPEPAELGGASGTYLEVRVPAAFDAQRCEGRRVTLPGTPLSTKSWRPGYFGRWWVLDVDGQRVVVQQNCAPCAEDAPQRMARIAGSITFAPAP